MKTDQHIWRVWARNLHRWGVNQWVAAILEAAGPLTFLGAQAVYLGQPLLMTAFPKDHIAALANLLEDSTQTRAFADILREDLFQ